MKALLLLAWLLMAQTPVPPPRMPDVMGLTPEEAAVKLREARLPEPVLAYSAVQEGVGRVIRQIPPGGADLSGREVKPTLIVGRESLPEATRAETEPPQPAPRKRRGTNWLVLAGTFCGLAVLLLTLAARWGVSGPPGSVKITRRIARR
ncbi:MAG: PASTA domain-containing protein [Candidatus Eremiobacterota bacterium]